MSANNNGLLSSRDVAANGNKNSNFFQKKGEAIVTPFVELISPDGTKTALLTETNSGSTFIDNSASGGPVYIKPGADHNLVVEGTIVAASAIGLTLTRSDLPTSSVDFEIDQSGSAIINSDGSIDLFPQNTSAVNITSDVGLTIQPASTFSPATLTIQNIIPGNTSGFALQVAPLGGALSLTGEVNGVAAGLPSMTAAADGSYVSFQSDVVKVVGDLTSSGSATSGLVIEAVSATGNAGLLIQNNNATSQGFQLIVGGQTAGGISEDHLQCYAYTNGGTPKEIFDFTPDGSSVVLGEADAVGGCFVGINGPAGVGRCYDSAYNPVMGLSTIYTSPSTVTGPTTLTATVPITSAGLYQIQMIVNLDNGGGPVIVLPVSGSFTSFIQRPSSPNNYRYFSEFNVISQQIIAPPLGSSNSPSFSSGIFNIPTIEDWQLQVEVDGTWDFGSNGYLQYQLIKIG